jgi:2-dehydropantoate 2-reductase
VYISSMLVGPGEVRQIGGTGKIFFGCEPISGQPAPEHARFSALVDVFQAAGIPAEYHAEVRPAVWEKYLFISPLATAGTALGQSFGELRSDARSWALLEGLLRELEAVAAAQGVTLPENIHPVTLNKALGFPPDTRTSMQVDAERGKPLELETLTGYVVRAAHRLGVPAPLYAEMYRKIKTNFPL